MLVWGDGGGIKLEISNWNFLFPVLHLQFRNYSVTEEKPRLTPEKFLHKGFKYIYIYWMNISRSIRDAWSCIESTQLF